MIGLNSAIKDGAITLLGILLLSNIAVAQTSKLTRADALYKAGGYFEAIELYRDDIDKVKDKIELSKYLYKIGNCYRLIGNARQAELWYQKAILRECPDPKVFFYYAEMLKMGEKYDEAIEQYRKYKILAPLDKLADSGIESCELAKRWKETPSGYEIINMRGINTKFSEFSPAYASNDYTELLFTSSRKGTTGGKLSAVTGESFTDIFLTTRDVKGVWSDPKAIDETVNTQFDEGAGSLTSDFNTVFFTRCKVSKRDKLGCQIFSSKRVEQGWLTPDEIKVSSDSMIVAHPAISADGTTLYFASNIAGGFGGLDIWKVTRASSGDEWGEAINLGGEVNSPADDFGVVFEREREAGYFSSRRQGGRGADDIYMFYLPPIIYNMIGKVTDDKTKTPVNQATVKLIGSDGAIVTMQTKEDGTFKFNLTPNTDYVILASKKGFLNNKAKETTRGLTRSKDFDVAIAITSTEKPIEIPNIFYDYDKWELRPESREALDRLVEILNDNPTVTIELASHTDSRGTQEYNYELSQKRAQSVVNYLIEKGIATDRLKAKGYAQTQPKVVDAALNARYTFLPIGVILDQKFVDGLTSEENKEVVYQINRRTEFRVLRDDYPAKQ